MNGRFLASISNFDIESYLLNFGFSASTGDNWIGFCPSCGKKKLSVNVEKKLWHCWVCQSYETVFDNRRGKHVSRAVSGAGGLAKLMSLLEGIPVAEANQRILDLGGYVGIGTLSNDDALDPAENPLRAVDFGDLHTTVHPYMAKRGITPDIMEQYGLSWSSSGFYKDRMIFPIVEGWELVYFQARALYEKHEAEGKFVKCLNPPSDMVGMLPATHVLFNLEQAATYPRVAICEGPMDVISAGPDAVATLGKKMTEHQMAKLRAYGVTAVDLMWDGPGPTEPLGAWPEMLETAAILSQVFDTRVVFLPKGDPGEYTKAELDRFREKSPPFEYLRRNGYAKGSKKGTSKLEGY